ncbi:MAG: 50S ribosomal protein L27 [Candidatus Andersenbacteria bacterium]|nr:50S ribosomal protein L27 [Candidatus Andersenbacteria bacterium]MBI3250426.1 50S ribosomal protein L27 [Candidatus Andersenbacteria bacterium]
MAHKKAGGSTKLGRDSASKRLGVKIYGGQPANPGEVIIRQRGTRYRPGVNVRRAGDDTLYAVTAGTVEFSHRKVKKFTGKLEQATFVSVQSK